MRQIEGFDQNTSNKARFDRIKRVIKNMAQRVSSGMQFTRKGITMDFERRLSELLASESHSLVEKIFYINQMIGELESLLEGVQHIGNKKDIEDFIARLKIQNQKLKRSEEVKEFDLYIEWKLVARNIFTRERLGDQLAGDIDQLIYIFTHKGNVYFDQIQHIQQMQNRVGAEIQREQNFGRKIFLENILDLLKVDLEIISLQSGITIEGTPPGITIEGTPPGITIEGTPPGITIEGTPRIREDTLQNKNTNPLPDTTANTSSGGLDKSIQDEFSMVMHYADNPNELVHNKAMKLLGLERKITPQYDQNNNPNMQGVVGRMLKAVHEKRKGLRRSAIDDAQLRTLNIENRTPTILPKEFDTLRFTRIEREWKVYLGKLQRLLTVNSDLAKRLSDYFLSSTLSEKLPLEFISIFPEIEVGSELRRFLAIDSVPEENIIGKLSRLFRTKDSMDSLFEDLASAQQFYPEKFQEILINGYKHIGVTREELYILIQRYRFAREVKILALMNTVKRLGNESKLGELIQLANGLEYQLSSSVKQEELKDLLDPTSWKNRTLINDRVHRVDIGGKSYIMKEWKSPKHTDHITGDKDPVSSYSEFMMAEELYQKGPLNMGDISVTVERPIVYIKTPDGYSFVLFDVVRSPDPYVGYQIRSHIQEYQDDSYKDEFVELNKRLKGEGSKEISFDDYMEIKANTLYLLKGILGELYQKLHGFEHGDMGQFFIGFKDNGGRLGIEMTMFDLEFSHKTSHSQKDLIDLNGGDQYWKSFLPISCRPDLEDAVRIMFSFATELIRSELGKLLE